MRELLRGVAALAMLAFIAYPAITHAPTEYRILPVISLRPSATIIFGGDMMFDRTIRKAMDENGEDYIFSIISDYNGQISIDYPIIGNNIMVFCCFW